MNDIAIDRYDLLLLEAIQQDGHATNAVLGERVNLSASQVSRRLQRLEESKVVAGYAALLDPGALGLGVTAYAHVVLERHDPTHATAFERAVVRLPEVLECFAVTGEADYLLRVVAPDLPTFSDLMMKRLLTLPGVQSVKTNIALSRVKETHVLPLDHVARPKQFRRSVTFTG
ncbi:MAG: Lrp/AsnC family transcriptional regulator [Burkholderiales bacterium]